jgi:CBS domain-containing protein
MEASIRTVLADKGHTVFVTTPETTVQAAVAKMNERHVGALVVIEAERTLVGIFSERDVLQRVVARNVDPARARVRDVMTRQVVVISPDITVAEAMAVITHRRCRHIPVMEGGVLLGLISSGDLTRWVIKDQARDITDLFHYIHGCSLHVASYPH